MTAKSHDEQKSENEEEQLDKTCGTDRGCAETIRPGNHCCHEKYQ